MLSRMASSFISRSRRASISPSVWGEWGSIRATTSAWGSRPSSSSITASRSKPSTGRETSRFSPAVWAPSPRHSPANQEPMCPAPATRTVAPERVFIFPGSVQSRSRC